MEKLEGTQILVDAKGVDVSQYGLVDIAIIGLLHITGWSPK